MDFAEHSRKSDVSENSMHLRGIFRWCFTQVGLVFNLDVLWLICLKLIYFHISFQLNYDSSIFKIWNVWILGKMINLNPKIKIYLLAWHFHRLDCNKLAKDVRICVLKNSVDPFMSKSIFFLNECTKTCWSNFNSPNIRQFILSFRWNKLILT